VGIPFQKKKKKKWEYIWGSGTFSSKKAYTQLIGSLLSSPLFKWLWNSCVFNNHKLFWLLIRERDQIPRTCSEEK
jgi:hypothetical protein